MLDRANSTGLQGFDGGIELDELAVGAAVELKTSHHLYSLENMGHGNVLISGHPKYCPQPLMVQVHGSIDETGNLRWQYLGKGMRLAFLPPDHGIIITSRIDSIATS
jgi:hypothetical protein